ncbi:MAG TPA: Asp-tRNA(Asn)/Glu-tRNA(Gln) amidotransferase subunit GatC [Saprospiraceae bacterium]|nr:Asp-tRNA(Asn)/Glu-tRNA(Gln) amidotransferase subunit GatC [Saprospiraceae bacterium]
MKVDDDLILKLEILAKLKLSDDEKEVLKGDLEKIIDMFSLISEVNTDDVEPLRHINNNFNTLRDDEVLPSFDIEQMKDNAPKLINNQFAVPKVIE